MTYLHNFNELIIYTQEPDESLCVARAAMKLFTEMGTSYQEHLTISFNELAQRLTVLDADEVLLTRYAHWIVGAMASQKSPCGKHLLGPLFVSARIDEAARTLSLQTNELLARQLRDDLKRSDRVSFVPASLVQ